MLYNRQMRTVTMALLCKLSKKLSIKNIYKDLHKFIMKTKYVSMNTEVRFVIDLKIK